MSRSLAYGFVALGLTVAFASPLQAQTKPLVDQASLSSFSPRARADLIKAIVDRWDLATEAEITSTNRVEHFIAQLATETGGFRLIAENLNYSAPRLRQIFPRRVSEQQAAALAHRPVDIANHVYNGRLGNSPPMDGWNFRGSGLIQLTGRANFSRIGKELELPLEADPDFVRTPAGAFQTAVGYWRSRRINPLADTGDIRLVRKAVNGGAIGLPEARIWLARAKAHLRKGTGAFIDPREELDAVADQLQALGFMKSQPGAFQVPDVKSGLAAFQSSNGLAPTGELDEDTLYELTDPVRFQTLD
jgi:putative chitinase